LLHSLQQTTSVKTISKVQQSLTDKASSGDVDGLLGPSRRLDAETAGKLGVGPESIGGNFKGADKR
jgi:hypothetical protein